MKKPSSREWRQQQGQQELGEIPELDPEAPAKRKKLIAFWKQVKDRVEMSIEEQLKLDVMGPAKDYIINKKRI